MANEAVLLTYDQEVAIRFHLGYPNRMSDDSTVAPFFRLAELEALDFKLTHLSASENTRVQTQLAAIETAYTNWMAAQANLAFASAAIITNRQDEMQQREAFYLKLCKYLASMIGVPFRGTGGDAAVLFV